MRFAPLLIAGLVGCAHQTPPPAPAPAPASTVAADPLSERLRHCPLTVDGASVDVRDVDGGVEFSIGVSSEEGRQELARRAHHLEEFTRSRGKGTGVPHGKGQGGGWMRDCPIVTKDTIVESIESPDGARIKVTATTDDVDGLRSESRRRLVALRARSAPISR